ncbi:hypothetical protein E4T47_00540 [Aureobasidium subglaciale]|nr:hypothetical protein E4T47_00540 [Aureobasidium subglaciale]
MLSWIKGAKGVEEVEDPFPEAPETPAHVFAARAFKHAIFGTPAPPNEANYIQDTRITQSIEIESKPRTVTVEMPTRPKDDMDEVALPSAPGLSPTKPNGILMTPGTTRRNKSVTFGAQVVDNEGKKQGSSGLPNTFPGKFPSPWTVSDDNGLGQPGSASTRARTKLTAQLQEVRDSAQKSKTMQRAKDDTDLTMDYMEPRSQSGKYWKTEYQSYAEATQREMKKLVIKQKAAKDFAREKENEVSDLKSQLRQERLKVEKLEAKTKELAAQMKEFEKKLTGQTSQDTKNDIAKSKAENEHLRHDIDQVLGKKSGIANSPKRKTPKTAPAGDLWANAAFSSPFVDDAADKDQSPLRARDLNIQSQKSPKDGRPKPTKSVHTKRLSEDTFDISLALPQPSPEPLPRSTPRSTIKSTADMTIDELVEKYSPEKPQFDRLALPLGIGALEFSSGKPDIKVPTSPPKTGARISSLSDERKAKALARIEARRLSKLAAA